MQSNVPQDVVQDVHTTAKALRLLSHTSPPSVSLSWSGQGSSLAWPTLFTLVMELAAAKEVWASALLTAPLSNDIIPFQALLAGCVDRDSKAKLPSPFSLLSEQGFHRNQRAKQFPGTRGLWRGRQHQGATESQLKGDSTSRIQATLLFSQFQVEYSRPGPSLGEPDHRAEAEEGNGPSAYLDFPGTS